MGEIAESMLDGTVCEACGTYIEGDAPGHPRYCSDACAKDRGAKPRGYGLMSRDDDMSDTEMWRALKKHGQEKRASNLTNSLQLLIDAKIKYTSRNGGVHCMVECATGIIDFWPGTGKFIQRGTKKQGRGVRAVLELARKK